MPTNKEIRVDIFRRNYQTMKMEPYGTAVLTQEQWDRLNEPEVGRKKPEVHLAGGGKILPVKTAQGARAAVLLAKEELESANGVLRSAMEEMGMKVSDRSDLTECLRAIHDRLSDVERLLG